MFNPTRALFARDPHATSRTYYGSDLRQGAALIRARRPYLVKNAITGLTIFAFTALVYTYTIRAVSQDDFVDVIIPTDETRIKFDDDDEPIPEQPKR